VDDDCAIVAVEVHDVLQRETGEEQLDQLQSGVEIDAEIRHVELISSDDDQIIQPAKQQKIPTHCQAKERKYFLLARIAIYGILHSERRITDGLLMDQLILLDLPQESFHRVHGRMLVVLRVINHVDHSLAYQANAFYITDQLF